jgi:hypothetical protein
MDRRVESQASLSRKPRGLVWFGLVWARSQCSMVGISGVRMQKPDPLLLVLTLIKTTRLALRLDWADAFPSVKAHSYRRHPGVAQGAG